MNISRPVLCIFLLLTIVGLSCKQKKKPDSLSLYSGSESCIQCHERFYKLWSPSHHGKAMQPVTGKFLAEDSIVSSGVFELEGKMYEVTVEDSLLVMIEKSGEQQKEYKAEWALGGKNVYYFLTPLDKGKLQTMPLAFDVRTRRWYNNPQSAVRHFPEGMPDEALPWKDRMYTFNSSCYGCHVSQLSTNFDLSSDSYQTTWREPGINCETCHGPSAEHVRVCLAAGEGVVPPDLKIIITKNFTHEQHNSSCAPCHAKMQPITSKYIPGDRFFDNYNLTTLENTDFYADGRDLGENYTYTGWLMNECVLESDIHCVNCHTSSGRNKFRDNPNNACLPCHEWNVNHVSEHSRHQVGSKGAICVNCHMPKTEFGRMVRSDHSMRPPMPEATILFGSPNACNICHNDKSPAWANEIVKKRQNSNYQNNTIYWAGLLKKAREGDWSGIDKILDIIRKKQNNEIILTSFIRVLSGTDNPLKWPVLIGSLDHPSPLVRSAAAVALTGNFTDDARKGLLRACNDEFRLVRISAAISLAGFPNDSFTGSDKALVDKATEEYKLSMVSRPDDWSAHYNMGIFYQNRGEMANAIESYETSAKLYPEAMMPLINSSVLYSYVGNYSRAEENLRRALSYDPDNEAANLNLGLLLAEKGNLPEAEQALKLALQANPKQAVAAYNLSVILARENLNEAIKYAGRAAEASPEEPKYSYTLAYYQSENGQTGAAEKTLREIIKRNPEYLNAINLLADILINTKRSAEARRIYQEALKTGHLNEEQRAAVNLALKNLESK